MNINATELEQNMKKKLLNQRKSEAVSFLTPISYIDLRLIGIYIEVLGYG